MAKCLMTFISVPILTMLFALFVPYPVSTNQQRQPDDIKKPHGTLKVGWHSLYPYQYKKDIHGALTLMGLDVKLIRAIAKEIDYDLAFTQCTWEKLLEMLRNGQLDIGLNAINLPERKQDFWISDPVRSETTALYVNRDNRHHFSFKAVDGLLDFVRKHNMKLGIKMGAVTTNDAINLFIKDPTN
jgi:ABC-type amino acid transport substrate-binding protein